VSVGALVQYVGEVLGRAHSLFGDPPDSGGPAAVSAGNRLGGARDVVAASGRRVDAMSGAFPASYGDFAGRAGPALDGLAGRDDGLGGVLTDAAAADRSGRGQSGAVVNGAAADATVLAPWSGTAAGQQVLLTQLRGRLAQQQQVLAAYRARDARLAAVLRSMAYRSRLGGAGMPLSPSGLGGSPAGSGLGSIPGLSGLSGLSGLANDAGDRNRGRIVLSGRHGIESSVPPLGALSSSSGPREVAAAISREARRRGYSPAQAIAILSTGMQESGLNPRAVSPNGLWKDIFQQDSSYPGRGNPNTAVSEFFDRLGAKGGPASPDIWKSIFWLQQAPGASSAGAAYAQGRRGYLSEIQSQVSRATQLYHELTNS
jgi:hypothetical protein